MAGATALPDLGGLMILLAEDNETNQLVASEMLRGMGAEIEVAADGAEALEMLAERTYDALLVDIEMPRVSGLEVIRRVRRAGGVQASRAVLALTAYAMVDHREQILSAGADGVIAKPITSIEGLGTTILEHVGRRTAARAGGRPAAVAGPVDDPEAAPLELDALLEIVGPERRAEFLSRLECDLAAAGERAAEGAEARDVETMRAAAHVLTSVAGTAGAEALQRLAQDLHARCAEGDMDMATDRARRAAALAVRVRAAVARRAESGP